MERCLFPSRCLSAPQQMFDILLPPPALVDAKEPQESEPVSQGGAHLSTSGLDPAPLSATATGGDKEPWTACLKKA